MGYLSDMTKQVLTRSMAIGKKSSLTKPRSIEYNGEYNGIDKGCQPA